MPILLPRPTATPSKIEGELGPLRHGVPGQKKRDHEDFISILLNRKISHQ